MEYGRFLQYKRIKSGMDDLGMEWKWNEENFKYGMWKNCFSFHSNTVIPWKL